MVYISSWLKKLQLLLLLLLLTSLANAQARVRRHGKSLTTETPGTLVVYVFSNSDREYEQNLRFFIKHAIHADDGCEYVFIIQTGEGLWKVSGLPVLPTNARYLHHQNGCYDWGTIGWFIGSNGAKLLAKYKYFIFMNASVRGPFIPSYVRDKVRWQDLLTHRLNGSVKLIGSTISCEGSPIDRVGGEWRTNPHVQSYVLATDQVGMKLWLDDGNVFGCYSEKLETIFHSELGASLAILKAGYNLDSFMARYQGVDWRDEKNWRCNDGANPYGEYYYDGISLNPYEVVFVKVKGDMVQSGWSYAMYAKKYEQWLEASEAHNQEISTNVWKTNTAEIKGPKIAYLRQRGNKCFDFDYFMEVNKDLPASFPDKEAVWEYFVTGGQFEGRPFRFTCDYDQA